MSIGGEGRCLIQAGVIQTGIGTVSRAVYESTIERLGLRTSDRNDGILFAQDAQGFFI